MGGRSRASPCGASASPCVCISGEWHGAAEPLLEYEKARAQAQLVLSRDKQTQVECICTVTMSVRTEYRLMKLMK